MCPVSILHEVATASSPFCADDFGAMQCGVAPGMRNLSALKADRRLGAFEVVRVSACHSLATSGRSSFRGAEAVFNSVDN